MAEIKEFKNNEIEKIISSNQLIEDVFTNLSDEDDLGLKTVFSALLLPEKEFAFLSETILAECEKSRIYKQMTNGVYVRMAVVSMSLDGKL